MRADRDQLDRLLEWARPWPERTWAVEELPGWGTCWPSPLLAGGERVLDVPPKLAAKARLLSDGDTNKNDPNDARSVAVAGLRSAKVRPAGREDFSAVMGMWSDRYLELAAARTQVVCRLHALLCELLPGGFPGVLRANEAAESARGDRPDSPADHARLALAWQLLADLVRIDEQRRETKKHMNLAVKASGTTVTEVYGVGPFVACAVIGHVGDVSRFASRAAFAAYNGTAPVEVSSGEKKIYRLSRTREPPAQPRHPHGRGHPDPFRQQPRPGLLPAQTGRGQDGQRSPPGAQAADQRRHLRPPGRRRQSRRHLEQGSGRASGERL